ncbi:adenosine kinase [Magnetospira sp. QH-2]|uniref:adenosine kinase n=1 Tax=Magnetospira sp. (strain QH-2) TaxID=1288970 RepID=UPI0003E8135D|nr:adenosine kinase [Magnetospira sp. QH-2]CCQ72225.1 Putative Carbohydrate/purine kinase [Magnetospira sp. QH-2]
MTDSPAPDFQVLGIGNAIVDVLSQSEDSLLTELDLTKGAMTLIDATRADALYARMGPGVECSGGSAANTIAGLASLGSKAAYVGKVASDQLGQVFRHDVKALGVHYDTKSDEKGAPTARCLIFVTPDAQRTMQTFLGACVDLGPEDIDPELVGRSAVTYLEGYLWDPPRAKEAFVKAALSAHQAHRKVALSLSDAFCVDRHRDSFIDLVKHHVDLLFANEDEIKSLFQVATFDEAMHLVPDHVEIAAITRGERGSVVWGPGEGQGELHIMEAEPVDHVIDTTGAGDAYAAGFLHGFTQGDDLARCARLGGICSAEVISHYGARPESALKALAAEKLG